jgi:eukaryotic-like serine/threonine-protein kinase
MEDRPMPKQYQPGQQIDHYMIIELLGQGGDSTVYLAQDQQNQQQVVLKFPHVDDLGSKDIFARYQRTRSIGKRLVHPGIQHHLREGETRSEEYLVLEYLSGQTLRAAMNQHAPTLFPVDEVLRIMLPIVKTLSLIHEQGVIHRDIKPENIWLLEDDGVALFDFGIAQWQGERFLHFRGFSTLIGTPAYMAPELLQARTGSVATDIYAVGVVLYELLCGHTPFQEHHGFEFLTEHISHDPPALLDANPEVLPALATVVMHAIRRAPGKRYPSMKALAKDLANLDQVSPETYHPDPPLIGGRFRPALRIALLTALIFLVIIAFGILAQLAHPALK